jgi:hypothetical protein
VKLWLIDLDKFSGVKNGLNEDEITQVAFYIVEEYRNLTISDIHLIFTRAKTGKYGEFYENLSMPKILKWFSDYSEDRMNACMNRSITKNNEYKSHISDAPRGSYGSDKEYTKNLKEKFSRQDAEIRIEQAKNQINNEKK